jgi:hypothetical protein
MQLVGDAEGIAALKALVTEHKDYLKFLIAEAQSNTDHSAPFRAADGGRWQLVVNAVKGELEVRKAP